MDVERSSLCNCVVNFLLEENYLLTAFELLHELLDDGRDVHAIRLKEFFSDSAQFPPDQISRFNVLRIADPQILLEEKVAAEEKLAITEYELRLAQEDFNRLKDELHKINESLLNNSNESNGSVSVNHELNIQRRKKNGDCSDLGSLKDIERRDINCAVKEYLLLAGYRLTAMTFYEEVIDQNLDICPNTPACVPDALRHYYYQYLSCTTEAAEEKISMHREIESLRFENEMLNQHKISLMKSKDVADGQIVALTKSLEHIQKDLKDKEKLVQGLRQSSEVQRKELNGCQAEITSLKMHIEGYRSAKSWASSDDQMKVQSVEKYEDEIKSLHKEIESLKARVFNSINSGDSENVSLLNEEKVVEIHEDRSARYQLVESSSAVIDNEDAPTDAIETFDDKSDKSEEVPLDTAINHSEVTSSSQLGQDVPQDNGGQLQAEDVRLPLVSHTSNAVRVPENTALGTVQILADALPKIVPYVLINHREELLPLIMCAIERHPDSSTRDSLTHTLFNLIKRPDEQQRQIIMEACVSLAKNVGEMRTETELLPQCWEQINHMYEERRLLVAQSCSQLALFVRPEICDSLIFSIIQQLIEDSATVVREAAAHNLSLLLPLFPNADKYFKVEELMFQLMCDPSGVVVETALKELLPAVMSWGNKLDHVLRVLLSHILGSAQRCPPLSGVEGSVESYLHVLGERERWNIDVLLRMLTGLLPFVHQQAINTCPFPSASESSGIMFSTSLLELYAGGHVEWPAFEWLHNDCFPDLIRLACLLPQKEDGPRNRITKLLLTVTEYFGDHYLTHMMLPLFLVAVGDDCSLTFFPAVTHACIIGLKPKTAVAEKLANICVLPLLLAGVLGSPSKNEQLLEYLRKLLVQGPERDIQTAQISEVVNAVRFLCTYEQHHNMIFNVLWEMVVSSSITMKTNAASLIKVIVPNIDAKVASTHVLPALVTLGSDQNLSVKYASIDAFGSMAQHFKNDMIVDKIRVQMDAFLEDGSHEATIAVVRALMVAAPHTTDRLRDYLVSKIYQITSVSVPASNVMRRRERANAFCEAIRALDATDLSTASVREFLLPSIQNLLKDPDAIDPAHKEALEIIMKERSGGTFEAISKVMGMGAHLGITSSVSSFFGEGGLLGKKDSTDTPPEPVSPNDVPLPPAEDTRFRRIMRGNFTDMLLRGKAKGQDENQQSQ